jgi:hypothetical protein
MKRKLLFPLIAALLLAPWPITYAYDSVNAANAPVTIAAADISAAPQMQAFGQAIGGVSPGELYRVDTSATSTDTLYTLYLTNTDELVKSYRYLTLNIGIYVRTGTDGWQKVTAQGDFYLTMQNGLVSFTLPGNADCKITIEQGCFYCYGAGAAGKIAVPVFNLAAS